MSCLKTRYNYFLSPSWRKGRDAVHCSIHIVLKHEGHEFSTRTSITAGFRSVYQKGSGLGYCALSCHKKLTSCSGEAKQQIELNTSIVISYLNMSGSTYVVSSENLAICRADRPCICTFYREEFQ